MQTLYSEDKSFSLQAARELEGHKAFVTVRSDGLTHTYFGVVRPLTRTTTFVGDDVIYNNCVTAVRASLPPACPRVAAIWDALKGYTAGQEKVIEQMANERLLNPMRLTADDLLKLITEEAAWSEQFGAHPHTAEEERASHYEYAQAMREIVQKFT